MKKIGIINGPNLNRLGRREPGVYGNRSLDDLHRMLTAEAKPIDVELVFFQSNCEGEIIDQLHALEDDRADGVVFNPGAYAHTSIALRDAIAGSELRVIEVHISNIYSREAFRHTSLLAPVCMGTICGLGLEGYVAALRMLARD